LALKYLPPFRRRRASPVHAVLVEPR
jgi:hypothetical protein